MCFDSNPPSRDMGKEFQGFIDAYTSSLPQIYQSESTYRPLFSGLDVSNLQSTLFGAPGTSQRGFQTVPTGQYDYLDILGHMSRIPTYRTVETGFETGASPGLFNVMEASLPYMSAMTTKQRAAEIADVASLGPAAVQALKMANPEQAALMGELSSQALTDLQAGANLDPSLAREVTQAVRGGQAARGVGFGPADIFTEAYARGMTAEQLRQNRRQFAQQMVGLQAGTQMDPFLAVLGRQALPATYPAQMMNQAYGMNTGAGPRLINPLNPYAQDFWNTTYNAQAGANINKANLNAALLGSIIQGVGSLGGAAIGCWVAREIYGMDDTRWLEFRTWLFRYAPAWFRMSYLRHGERFAGWLKGHPRIKSAIRWWMDRRIATLRVRQ